MTSVQSPPGPSHISRRMESYSPLLLRHVRSRGVSGVSVRSPATTIWLLMRNLFMSARVAVHSLSASLGPIPKQLIYCTAFALPLSAVGLDTAVVALGLVQQLATWNARKSKAPAAEKYGDPDQRFHGSCSHCSHTGNFSRGTGTAAFYAFFLCATILTRMETPGANFRTV